MAKRDYYEVLGVDKNASQDDLKRAYRKLGKQYHPDENPGDKEAEAKFKEVGEAYAVLSDSDKRAAYDQFGHQAFDGNMGGAGYGGSMDFDFRDIFSSVFEDFFGSQFSGSRAYGREQIPGYRHGADVQVSIQITFNESVFGTEKEIQLNMNEKCGNCGGTGAKPGTYPESCRQCGGTGQERVQQQTVLGRMMTVRTCNVCRGEGKVVRDPCPTCGGRGSVRANKKIMVQVPKGIDSGQVIRLTGVGEPGKNGGSDGDLLVAVYVKPHEQFKREGMTLRSEMNINIVQASLGDRLTIPTIYGDEQYQLNPGTQPGTVIKLRGKGMPSVRNPRNVGDLEVTLKVVIPTRLTDKQENLLRQFALERGEKPSDSQSQQRDKKQRFGKTKK